MASERAGALVRAAALLAALVLPWLLPFAPGPSASVVPWLAGAACGLVVLLLAPSAAMPRGLLVALAAIALLVLLRPGNALDQAALIGAMVLVLVAAATGRGMASRWGDAGVRLVATAWLAAALLSAAIGLLQYFQLAAPLQPWVHPGAAGEALGNLRQRNQLASLLAIGLAAALWFAGRGGRLRWLLPAVVLLGLASAATTSRTGLLHWMVLAALAVLWRGEGRRARLALAAAGVAAYAVAAWLLPLLLEHATGASTASVLARVGSDLGCSSRSVLWSNVLRLVAQRPLLGWGWGELDYAHYMTLYGGPRFCDILDNAHNLPLHVAVELGVPVALVVCAAIGVAAFRARPWAEGDGNRRLAWSVLAVLAVHSMLEYPLWYAPFQIALGLSLGLLLAAPGDAEPAPSGSGSGGRVWLVGACTVLLSYATWDYLRVSQIYLEPAQRLARWREDTQDHVRRSWLFAGQARFAELTLTDLTPRTVDRVDAAAQAMLHYSPEPRVIEKVIESATMQGRYDDAVLHLARYRAAFPAEYERWRQAQKLPIGVAPRP